MELIALSLLAGLGFGLALVRGDVIFVAVFGAASVEAKGTASDDARATLLPAVVVMNRGLP
jgi:hypothetical protein